MGGSKRVKEEGDELFLLGAGPIGAVLLGMVLIPFRELTTASNLTFVFLLLIIVVAELGGRRAAVATAVSSALSLNFFLTRPYLELTIHSRDDIFAFLGLLVCGLVAASLGSRGRRIRTIETAREQLHLLHETSRQIELAGPIEPRLTEVLARSGKVFPLAGAIVRDRKGQVLAVTDRQHVSKPVPVAILGPDAAKGRMALPADGARVALVYNNSQVGWLDIWGNAKPASVSTLRTLGDYARLIAAIVAHGGAVDIAQSRVAR